jgi:hypothetical protein
MSAADDWRGRRLTPPPSGAGQSDQFDAGLPVSNAPPCRLLWSLGIVAVVLNLIAFALWATSGGIILLDMMVALCA